MITAIFRDAVKSYRDLPRTLYHIQWKFRDEVRPRFGVMRGREFLMKDAYSFDVDEAGLRASYEAMFVAYLRTFARLGLQAVPVKAPTGPIGGDLSHEFHILAETGESAIFYDAAIEDVSREELLSADAATIARLTSLYCDGGGGACQVTSARSGRSPAQPPRHRVGHIFAFGTKYSASMGMTVQTSDGGNVHPHMGSYGVGVSRLMGAIIEASHDDAGIVWPKRWRRSGRPHQHARDDPKCAAAGDDLYGRLTGAGVETSVRRPRRARRAKFATMDVIGLPWQLIVGPKGLERGIVELKSRATGEREELSIESALARLTA
jgi:prolyl-tRNA synthetase